MGKQENRILTIAEALREGIIEEMERDPSVICIGEDIGIPDDRGGAFIMSYSVEENLPQCTINAPVSEIALFGSALGSAVMGMRPVADVQYGDFLLRAIDKMVSQISMMRYMSEDKAAVPLVMRMPVGVSSIGAQYIGLMESWFMNIPGIKVVCPSNAYDAKGMLKEAVRDAYPVLILEHELLCGSAGDGKGKDIIDGSRYVPREDYTVPLGKAAIVKEGTDVTILSTMLMLHGSQMVADELEQEGISCEVVDLRSLVPLDTQCIFKSIQKTGRVVIVEECTKRGGWSAELAATAAQSIPDVLTAPIMRIASFDTPLPFAPVKDSHYLPSFERIKEGVMKTIEY